MNHLRKNSENTLLLNLLITKIKRSSSRNKTMSCMQNELSILVNIVWENVTHFNTAKWKEHNYEKGM